MSATFTSNHLTAALGPDDEHAPAERWPERHPLAGRQALIERCHQLDATARHGDRLRGWWLNNRGVAGDMPIALVALLDAFAGYDDDTPAPPIAETPTTDWLVICADGTCRHGDPFPDPTSAARWANEDDHGCRGGPHDLAVESHDRGCLAIVGGSEVPGP